MTAHQPRTVDRGVVVPREALGDVERRVIDRLVDSDMAFSFGAMEAELQDHDGKGPSVDLIGAACRMLAARGLAVHRRGLFNEDGDVYGSGYAATDLARAGLAAPAQSPAALDEAVGLLRRLSDDLHAELMARYGDDHAHYPSIKRKFTANMEVVEEARAFLANLEPSQ